jgi:hypothetical protein
VVLGGDGVQASVLFGGHGAVVQGVWGHTQGGNPGLYVCSPLAYAVE